MLQLTSEAFHRNCMKKHTSHKMAFSAVLFLKKSMENANDLDKI